jgi:hypothetical protein
VTLRPSVLHSLWDNAQEPPLPSPGSVEIIEEIEQGKRWRHLVDGNAFFLNNFFTCFYLLLAGAVCLYPLDKAHHHLI